MSSRGPFFGKYRGTVLQTVDPERIGRIQVIVPAVTGPIIGTWAMPCLPIAGLQMGMLATPIIGSGVWIEYEGGDADYPIWSGCFYGTMAEVPAKAQTIPPPVPGIAFATPLGTIVAISDTAGPMGVGGIVLQSVTGATISVSDVGIIIDNAKGARIAMIGPSVDINTGALTVI